MNHIFRVIFDHTRGVFIAVSELTRNKIKSSKSSRSLSSTNPPKRLLSLSAIALLVGGGTSTLY
ncbi:hypothetical protein QV08_04715 [Gallibacterium salpingitidis]|uniref:ESPR domain-containing protein n=1 Tax=Gallibacterium salpingitidis TaxID=505341 RepID=UPI000804EA19|nr:ESPR domain-containing protein [Gallibacterium salpingitidis]OBX08512.1 hypothetical protein QV08_04715 [Gallibacterium salpingitidis]WKS99046.1 ESPR domain-containing protein [Gallibacterium salpingitidis]